MSIKYIIRRNEFSYNDEYFSLHSATPSVIKAIYDNKAEAEEAYKSLVVEALYQQDNLYEYNGDSELAQRAYQFVVDNNIQIELEEDETLEDLDDFETFPDMSEDDAFKFAQEAGLLWYLLIEFDDQQPIYVLWSCKNQQYLEDAYGNIFDSLNEDFSDIDDFDLDVFEDDIEEYIIDQDLDDISDSPQLLKSLIEEFDSVEFEEDHHSISSIDIYGIPFTELKSINALLKSPIFEIRKITLEQLKEITNGKNIEI